MVGMRQGYNVINGVRVNIPERHNLIVLIDNPEGIDLQTLIYKNFEVQKSFNDVYAKGYFNYKSPTIKKALWLLILKGLVIMKRGCFRKNFYYVDERAVHKYFNLGKEE